MSCYALLQGIFLIQGLNLSLLHWQAVDFPGGSDGKESACSAGDLDLTPGLGRSLEEGMTTHSSILAWRIPWTEEPGGLQSVGSKESDMTEQLSTSQHTRSTGFPGGLVVKNPSSYQET